MTDATLSSSPARILRASFGLPRPSNFSAPTPISVPAKRTEIMTRLITLRPTPVPGTASCT